MKKTAKQKMSDHIRIRYAWKKLRLFLREKCIDVETGELGNMRYGLEKYFELIGVKKPNKKSTLILLAEYDRRGSQIYKGDRVPGLSLKKVSRREQKNKYKQYIKSQEWKDFKKKILAQRGCKCESCEKETDKLDLHHKTYARLFNELPQDVLLLCRDCHQKTHGQVFTNEHKRTNITNDRKDEDGGRWCS